MSRAVLDHRLRIPLFVLGLALGARLLTLGQGSVGSLEANVAAALEARTGAMVGDPALEVRALDPVPGGALASTRRVRFVALARPVGVAARDLYRMEARVTGNGAVVELGWAVNLTRSSAADDAVLAVYGQQAVTLVLSEGALAAVELRDFAGDGDEAVATWPALQRLMAGVTNVEQTGAWEGVRLAHHDVSGPPVLDPHVQLGEAGAELRVAGRLAATLPLDGGPAQVPEGSAVALVLSPRDEKMQMDLLNWVADRGRGFADQGLAPAWLGSSVELAKEVYFQAKVVKASVEELGPEPDLPGEAPPPPVVAQVQEAAVEKALELARRQARESDFPWPPPPIPTLLSPALEGEGLWTAVPSGWSDGRDTTPLLYSSFVRPSGDYAKKAVRLWTWDPRRGELRMRAGTHEPVPQTAVKGDGRITREPAVLNRVVLAFNGGFQTTHRAFGMMVDGKVLLKPRTYGATIALLNDGRPAFGTWAKGAGIPEEFVSWRQNLEPLLEDGVFNAYRRVRFGAHENVAGAKDGWTVRSALCHTPEGHLIYAYAEYANERALALALKQARCVYAIHLDMNPGHTGIERYRHLAANEEPEVAENLREVEGVRLEGVLGHANVKHMNRPTRYLGTDYRDFFYVLRREVLPGPPLGALVGRPGEGVWLTDVLPQNQEVPPRVAVTALAGLAVTAVDLAGTQLTLGPQPGAVPMLSVPVPCEQGPQTITVAGVALHGAALSPPYTVTGQGTGVAGQGTVVAHSGDRLVVLAGVTAENAALVSATLLALAPDEALWCPSAETPGPLWAYDHAPAAPPASPDPLATPGQPASPDPSKLVELTPGDEQGVVVAAPSTTDRRLWVSPSPRPARVVRYWPDANPYRGDP